MRRMVLSVVVGCCLVAGCQDPKKSQAPTQSAGAGYDTMQPDSYMTDSGSAKTSPSTVDYRAQEPPPVQSATPGRGTHVVAKGDTLFKLARTYYNDQARWKDIYAANQGVLSDPNVLRVGQELVIP